MASSAQLTAIIAILSISPAIAAPLSLEDYLSQVEGKSQNIASSKKASEGAGLRSAEAALTYSPVLFTEVQFLDDHFRNALLPTAYEKLQTDTYTIGLRQKTPWGLSGTVSYDVNKIGYINGLDMVTNQPVDRRFYEGTPKVELSLSLWKNLFGSETKAQEEKTRSDALVIQYNQSYTTKATRAQAQGTYVRLVAAKQLIAVYNDSLDQAKDLLGFGNRQAKLNLAENADLYQYQANFEVQKLNLQSALDEQRTAAREFNRLRNVDSDVVEEALVMPDVSQIKVPVRAKVRDDVRAAQETAKAAAAQAQLGAERNKPNLELYGSYAYNAREAGFDRTFSQSWKPDQKTTVIGLRFSVPLAFGLVHDTIRGFNLERDAAELSVSQKTFDQEVEWNDLVQKLDEAKKRYEIADSLAKIQRKKVENERVRLKRGRTTTYQTLTFTQDYNGSEASRVQAISNVFNIVAQMKTFEETNGEQQ